MPSRYEQELIRLYADIRNTAVHFGKHPDELFSDLADMDINEEISYASRRFPELS